VKLSVLKEEKRLLMLKLKAREARLRRDRGGELEDDAEAFESSRLFEEAMDTDDEDLDLRVAKMSDSLRRQSTGGNLNRRARSESPYTKCATATAMAAVHPEEFLSVQRKRSTSCGFNSDNSYNSDLSPPTGPRKYYTQDAPEFEVRRSAYIGSGGGGRSGVAARPAAASVHTEDKEVNTDPLKEPEPRPSPVVKAPTRERATNTDPPPPPTPAIKSPPPVRKVNHGTNTL